jgi:hypothetical protein
MRLKPSSAADAVGIVGTAEVFDVGVEAGLGEQVVALLVEDVPRGARQLGGEDPEFRLLLRLATAHSHREVLAVRFQLGCRQDIMSVKGFFNRLLGPTLGPDLIESTEKPLQAK